MVDKSIGRRSIRLKAYDYSLAGAYFVTICTMDRKCILGKIQNKEVSLNSLGLMVQQVWGELPTKYPGVAVDQFVVMPNHIHGIVILNNAASYGQPQGVAPTYSLPMVVHRFKSFTTYLYRKNLRNSSSENPAGGLWQRNYFEHIIRNEESLGKIRNYIFTNPATWESDLENKKNQRELHAIDYYNNISGTTKPSILPKKND